MLVKGSGDDSGMVAEINVTPLVDVMLVLLIVFMVTAPLLVPQSLGVKLPQTAAVPAPVQKNPTRLSIGADGALALDGVSVTADALRAQLQTHASDPKFQLQIEADEQLRYGRLAEVMALAQGAGVAKLSFVTVARNH